MDIFSHGLYGGVLVGRKNRRSFWTAFSFGVLPDLVPFGIPFLVFVFSGIISGAVLEPPQPNAGYAHLPQYVFSLYNATHSLIVFAVAFLAVWAIRKKPMYEMFGWGFHVVLDIFTHSTAFFPTPFLWPVSAYVHNGTTWGDPIILIPNVIILASLYGCWWYKNKKQAR